MKSGRETRFGRLLIVPMFLCLFLAGCDVRHTFTDYGFKDIEKQFAWGTVYGRLHGSDQRIDETQTIRASPYRLFVGFFLGITDGGDCQLTLRTMTLIGESGVRYELIRGKTTKKFQTSKDAELEVRIRFPGLDVEYTDYNIEISDLVIGCQNGVIFEGTINLEFEKSFKKEEITFWDQLMGI